MTYLTEHIDQLALAFIAPLSSQDNVNAVLVLFGRTGGCELPTTVSKCPT